MKVAVVGLGHVGSVHARLWREIPGVHLAALVDVDPDRAAARGREFGVPAFTDWRALPPDVEAVSLAVPTPLHGPLGVGILESGRDLLVEKPISATPEQADALIAAAARRGRMLMVGHTERFNPAFLAARREVKDPRFLEAQRLAPFVPRSLDVDVVLDLMIHDLDLALLLGGPEVEEVRAIGVSAFTDKIDIANARIRFASGCVANLTASRISRERVRKLRIFQPHRYLSVDLSARSLVACRVDPSGADALPAIREEAVEVPPGEPLRHQLQAFAEAVRRRESAGCTGQEARRALLLAHRVLEEIAL